MAWSSVRPLVLVIVAAALGCGSEVSPSVSVVTPGLVFLGRTQEVVVSGSATHWSDRTTVSFGEGVTVNELRPASATALVASITVAPTAELGARDVVVSDNGAMQVYKGAFTLESPVEVVMVGQLAQGSLATLQLKNKDLDHLFDTTATGDGFFTPLVFTNAAIEVPPGVTLQISNVSPFQVDAVLLVDVDAAPAQMDLDLVSGPEGGEVVHFPSPGVFQVTARSAIDLTDGAQAKVSKPGESTLYKLSPGSGTRLLELLVDGPSEEAAPAIALLPASGKFADLVGFKAAHTIVSASTSPYYVVVWDSSGAFGYDATVHLAQTAVTTGAEAEPNEDKDTATAIASLPYLVQGASLSTAADEDWYAVSIAAGDVGKKLHVSSMAGDAQTDLVVDVLAADGTTSLGGPSADQGYHEDFLSEALSMAGTYYVRVYASTEYKAGMSKYDLLLRLE